MIIIQWVEFSRWVIMIDDNHQWNYKFSWKCDELAIGRESVWKAWWWHLRSWLNALLSNKSIATETPEALATVGSQVCIHHTASKLLLEQSLGEQGVVNATQLCCVYVAMDLRSAMDFLQGTILNTGGIWNSDTVRRAEIQSQFALEGLTTLTGVRAENCLRHLPRGLRHLTLGHEFDRSLEHVILPSTLETLTFGARFNRRLDISLPNELHSLTFGKDFNQTLEHVTFPCGLCSLTFGRGFNCRLQNVTLPSSLQTLTLGGGFVQSFQGVTLPDGLINLTFGAGFNQNLDEFPWPHGLQNLTFGELFDQNLDKMTWPSNLQTLTFGAAFNQSLERVSWPCTLRSLTFGEEFNQNLQDVRLASGFNIF